ncbi:MAG TPA: DUF6766 family protein [Actinomycetota bacterium]|nr:DUF6766 family protein [Actinomycetota bacterium]
MLSIIIVGLATAIMFGIAIYLVWSLATGIRNERKKTGLRKLWANFGLSLVLAVLFFASWGAHAMAQWHEFSEKQQTHGEPVQVLDFLAEFSSATLENWQSEFLQLFSFVVLSALLIHRGSAESKDSDDRMEQALQRIEKALGTSKG